MKTTQQTRLVISQMTYQLTFLCGGPEVLKRWEELLGESTTLQTKYQSPHSSKLNSPNITPYCKLWSSVVACGWIWLKFSFPFLFFLLADFFFVYIYITRTLLSADNHGLWLEEDGLFSAKKVKPFLSRYKCLLINFSKMSFSHLFLEWEWDS